MRALGRSGIKVAPLAFGGNVFGWTADERTSFSLLDAFVDAGFNLIDSADVYSHWVPGNQGGESETIIGNWLRKSGKRDKVVIATKVGMSMGEGRQGLSRGYIRQAVEDSLRRLQIDCIDVYLSHDDDPDTALADTMGAYAGLIEQGKVRAIGASNYSAARFAEALAVSAEHGLPRYECMQPPYNLMDRATYEADLEALASKEDIGVIAYSALASGFLTGKYRGKDDLAGQARGGSVEAHLNARGMRVLRALDDVAVRRGATPAQVALAWLMARPGISAPIASATSVEQLRELVAAVDLKLHRTDIEALNAVSA